MSVRLVKIPNPMQPEINVIEEIEFKEGLRLDQCLVDIPQDEGITFVAAINGKIISKPHQEIFVKDKDIISVTAKTEWEAAGALAGWIAGSMWGSGVVIGSFQTALAMGVGTALVYGAVFMATMFVIGYGMSLLASALAPDAPDAGDGSPDSFGWDDLPNSMREGLQIPYIYGANRVAGQIITQYVHVDNATSKEYLNLLFGLCDHAVDSIGDVQFNKQPLDYYKDIEILDDTTGGESWLGFDDIITQVQVGVKLQERANLAGEDYYVKTTYTTQPRREETGVVSVPGHWVRPAAQWESHSEVRETQGSHVEVLKIYISAPRGVSHFSSKGSLKSITGYYVGVQVRYRVKDAPDWDANVTTFYFTGASKTTPQRKVIEIEGLPPAQYEMEVTSLATSSSHQRNTWDLYWSSFMEASYSDLGYPRMAKYAVKALATEQLSGGLPTVTALVDRASVQIWDKSLGTPAWVSKRATSPAWIVWDLLYEYAKIPIDRILWDEFLAWANFCDEDVSEDGEDAELRIEIGTIIQSGNIWEQIQRIARLGRAAIIRRGTHYGVFVDKYEGDTPAVAHLFNMSNILEDTFKIQYLPQQDRAGAVEIEYTDQDKDYTRQVITVQPEDEYPDQIANVSLKASMSKAVAVREGIFRINSNKHLNRVVEFDAAIDSFACIVGDLFYFQHELIDPDTSTGGRVEASTLNTVTLDREVVIGHGTYEILIRHESGIISTRTVTTAAGETTTISVTPNWSPQPGLHDIYTIGAVSSYKKIYRLTSVTRSDDLTRTITGLEYVPEIYSDNDGFIVDDTTPPNEHPVNQRALSISLHEQITYSQDGGYRSEILCSWFPSISKISTNWAVWLEPSDEGFNLVNNPDLEGTGGILQGGGGTLTGTLPEDWNVWSAGDVTATQNSNGSLTIVSTQGLNFFSVREFVIQTRAGGIYRLDCEVLATNGTFDASIQRGDYSDFLLTGEISAPGIHRFSGTEDEDDEKSVLFNIPANVEVTFNWAQVFQDSLVYNPNLTGTGGVLQGGGGSLTGTLPEDWNVWTAGDVTATQNSDGSVTIVSTMAVDFFSIREHTISTIAGGKYRLDCEILDTTGTFDASIQRGDYSDFLLTGTISGPGVHRFFGVEDAIDDKSVLFHIPADVEVTFKWAQVFQESDEVQPVKVASTTNVHARISSGLNIGRQYKVYVVVEGEGPISTGQNTEYITLEGNLAPPEDVADLYAEWDNIHRVIRFDWFHVNDIDKAYYQIRRGTDWDTATFVVQTVENYADVFFSEQYYGNITYLIKAVDTSGIKSENAESFTFALDTTTTDFDIPTGLTWTSISEIGLDGTDQVLIQADWDEIDHYEFDYFRVRIETTMSPMNKVTIYQVSDNSFQILALPNQEYTIAVAAVDRRGNISEFCTGVTHTTTRDASPPAAPSTLVASGTFTNILLSWSHGAENDLSHFLVYRHTSDSSGSALQIGNAVKEFSGVLGMFTDTPPNDSIYYYWIKAVDSSGNLSDFSNSASDNAPGVSMGVITATLIEDGSITTPKLAANAVIASKISAGVIGADHIAANCITAGKLDVDDLSAISANIGTLTAGRIQNSSNTSYFDLNTDMFSLGGALTWNGTSLSIGSGSVAYSGLTGQKPDYNADNTAANETFGSSDAGALATRDTVGNTHITSIDGGKITTGIIADGNDTWWNLNTNTMRLGNACKLEFADSANYIYGSSSAMFFYNNDNYMYMYDGISGGGISLSARAGTMGSLTLYAEHAAFLRGAASDVTIWAGANIYFKAGNHPNNTIFQFNGVTKTYMNQAGFVPQGAASMLLGNVGQRWAQVHGSFFYDAGGIYPDTFDDLEEMQKHKPVKKKVINKKTSEETLELDLTEDGMQKLDIYSLPEKFVNYEQVRQKLRNDNGVMINKADIEEFIMDYDEAGWMLARNVGRYNDMSAGAIRQLDHVVNDLSFELSDWINDIDKRLKKLE